MSAIQTEVVPPVDLDYTDKVPPVGEDHIAYAIKRNNISVRRTMMREAADVKIQSVEEQGACLVLDVSRPVDPYKPPSTDPVKPEEWETIRRIHRRLTVGEILADRFPTPLAVATLDKKGVVDAIKAAGIGIVDADVDVKIVGLTATVEDVSKGSYIWWGTGDVALKAPAPVVEA